MSDLATETQHDTTTFTHFDREWTVPVKRHTRHLLAMRNELASGIVSWPLTLAATFLPPDQLDALAELDPAEDELDAFADKIATALGLRNPTGNGSTPAGNS